MIAPERVRALFSYNPHTGLFTRIAGRANQPAGTSVRTVDGHGYIQITIDRKNYKAHRLAWLYMTGVWPKEIDHKNGVRDDNRWKNLRECERYQNAANSRGHSKTGMPKGVQRNGDRFGAKIYRSRTIYLGTFDTVDQASAAYVQAAHKLDGEFARGFELRECKRHG